MYSSDNEIFEAFLPLWQDVQNEDTYLTVRPLLAHYTSITNLEQILKNEEVWFSNPLNMNDIEEVRLGMREAALAFRKHPQIIAACQGEDAPHLRLIEIFDYYLREFENNHLFDTYVFCMTEHKPESIDGLLSMWRGYGGNGNGAAIIFDTGQFNFNQGINFLLLAKVNYVSVKELREWVDQKLREFAVLLMRVKVPKDKLHIAVDVLFDRLKVFSLFIKHHGFQEEREWRVAYLRDRDSEKILEGMIDYAIGRNGPEPKLKLKIRPLPTITSDFSLEKIISGILLGPASSSPLTVMSVKRMLERIGKTALAKRVTASTIPFRPF